MFFAKVFVTQVETPQVISRVSALAVPRAKLNEAMHLPGGMMDGWMVDVPPLKTNISIWGFPKIGSFTHKMDGENNGKPY